MITLLKNFYNENHRWAKPVVICFLGSLLVGGVLGYTSPEIIQMIQDSFAQEFGQNPALDINLARDIFLQNSQVAGLALIGGLVLGFLPVLIVVSNGLLLGYVAVYIMAQPSASIVENLLVFILGILPHGIIEIPMFLLAAVLGLRLGTQWLSRLAKDHRWEILVADLKYVYQFVPLIIVGLAVAALIEVFVTGKLLS